MKKKRLFLAVNLPKRIKRDLVSIQEILKKRTSSKAVKWVEEENLHLTLLFLGYVSEKEIEKVVDSLAKVKVDRFWLQLRNLGFFPHEKNPKIVWVGTKGEVDVLKKLYKEIVLVLKKKGLSFEPRFSPHLTLGRIKRGKVSFFHSKKVDQIIKLSKKFSVQKFALMESVLTRQGPKYSLVKDFYLYK